MTKGWLDNYNDSKVNLPEGFVGEGIFNGPIFENPAVKGQFQNGGKKKPITTREDFEPSILSNIPGLTSLASGNQPGYNRQEQYGPLGDLYKYYGGQPLEHDVLVESQNKPSTSKDKNAKYISLNHDREFVNEVLDNYERVSSGKLDKDIESKLNDNSWSVSGYSSAGKDAHKTKKQGSEHHSNAIGRYTLGKGKDKKGEYISYYDKFDQGTGSGMNPGEALGLTKPFEIYDRIYLKDVNRKFQVGGVMPGAVGHMYARHGSPSKGPRRNQTDVTDASAQNGKEMQYYQQGLDWKPKTISKNGAWLDNYEEAQTGKSVKFDPKKFAEDKKRNTPLQKSIDKESNSEDNRRWFDTKEYKDQVKANKAAEDKAILQDRKDRTNKSVAAQKKSFTKDNWRQQLADETQATGDKFRIFPEDPDSVIDEWMNPGVMIGSMASDLGSAPLRAQQEDSYMPYVTSIGVPLLTGGLEGIGAKTTGQFVSNLANPLNIIPGYNSAKKAVGKALGTEEGLLSNAYKLNPKAFKLNEENLYRQIGESGYKDAIESGVIRSADTQKYPNPYFVEKEGFNKLGSTGSGATNSRPKFIAEMPIQKDGELLGFPTGQEHMWTAGIPEVPLSDVGLYKKHWLQGYKEIPKQEDGGVIKDDRGQWDHPGEITEINSNDITMEGVPYDVLGISDTGDTKLMKPGKNYKFKGKKVTEYPMARNGVNQQDQKTLQQLDQLTNFTNYNNPQPGGWLNKYKS